MYVSLALKNVRKSFKDFLIYFLTLAFSVCLFYTFNSFQAQQAVLDMNESQSNLLDILSSMMTLLSFFVVIVLAFLILYANNFLIRRRKKELGLYTLLGMPKRKISRVLVYETFIIGLISLLTGMIAGIFVSQITTALTAGLFRVPLDYHFVFSPIATIITIISFGSIFFVTILFNTFILNRYKLIDLLNAERKNDDIKIKKTWVSVMIFIASLLCLGYSYYTASSKGFYAFTNIAEICLAGIVGTFLFFLSLSGFLLTLINHSKRLYLKNLNCFILRQIHSNINANFVSMGFVCIMLLLSIGALSTGLSLNHNINKSIKDSAPYDYTYVNQFYKKDMIGDDNMHTSRIKDPNTPENAEELIKNLPFQHSYIKNENYVKTYLSDITYGNEAFLKNIEKNDNATFERDSNMLIDIIPLSDYNRELRLRNYETISIHEGDVFLFSDYGLMDTSISNILEAKPSLTIFGNDYRVTNDDYHKFIIGTTSFANGSNAIGLVMRDNDIPSDAIISSIYWNVNHTNNITDHEFSKMIGEAIDKTNLTLGKDIFLQPIDSGTSRSDVNENFRGLSVIMTYIGIYLGIVFLIASAVILALQQLSQAADNKKRYTILSKIGTDQNMINRSILIQIAIYFMMPLTLAIVHSYVGIQMVNGAVISFGRSDITMSSFITAGIIACIYGSYFLVTYMGYKNVIKG